MNKHVNKVRKATGRAEAITASRQQNKQQYLIIQLMKKKESIKTGQKRQQAIIFLVRVFVCEPHNSKKLWTNLGEFLE